MHNPSVANPMSQSPSSLYHQMQQQYPSGAGGLASTSSRSSVTSTGLSNYSFGGAPTSTSTVPTTVNVTRSPSLFSDILSDDLFSNSRPSTAKAQQLRSYPSPPPPGSVNSPQPSSSGVVGTIDNEAERLAKEDPLATQVWKMYARTKASLPHAQRMENLTWRMMAMALKKGHKDRASQDALENKSASAPAGPSIVMVRAIILQKLLNTTI